MSNTVYLYEVTNPYLNNDHRERIDIRFLADRPFPVQNLRSSPSYCVPVFDRYSGPKVWGDRGETKIGQTCMTCLVHKNAWPLEISVNYTVGVKIAKTVSDIGYKTEPVGTWVRADVFRQLPARHPDRNELEGSDGDTQKRHDVWVFHAFPNYDFLAEGMRGLLFSIVGVYPRSLDRNL